MCFVLTLLDALAALQRDTHAGRRASKNSNATKDVNQPTVYRMLFLGDGGIKQGVLPRLHSLCLRLHLVGDDTRGEVLLDPLTHRQEIIKLSSILPALFEVRLLETIVVERLAIPLLRVLRLLLAEPLRLIGGGEA